MNAAVAREALRDGWFLALLVLAPFALAAQFVGDRPGAEVALSLVLISAGVFYAAVSSYRRAETRVATRRDQAGHTQLRTELATSLQPHKK